MLHVEKQQLLATNAQDIARFRATELQYYVEHIGSIQTIATLLAGFAFTAFLQLETVELDVQTVFLQRFRGEYKFVNGTYIERDFAPMDPMAIASFVVYAVEVFSVCFTFVEMISVLLETLIARLLGSRLALRGQDGSIIVATKGLAKSLLKATTRFIVGLQWFLFSVVCHAIRGMHPFISIVVLVTIFTYWRSQFALAKRLVTEFYLRKAVHTSWNELTGKVVTEADRQAAQAADDAEELRRKLALENRNGSSVAGRLYTRLQNAFCSDASPTGGRCRRRGGHRQGTVRGPGAGHGTSDHAATSGGHGRAANHATAHAQQVLARYSPRRLKRQPVA